MVVTKAKYDEFIKWYFFLLKKCIATIYGIAVTVGTYFVRKNEPVLLT